MFGFKIMHKILFVVIHYNFLHMATISGAYCLPYQTQKKDICAYKIIISVDKKRVWSPSSNWVFNISIQKGCQQ